MRFWDTSAVVPLLVDEPMSVAVNDAFRRDPDIAAWWATEVECVSALARLEREEALSHPAIAQALARLDRLAAVWSVVEPAASVRRTAIRILRLHPLRAADALQLAAARTMAEDHPEAVPLVTLDAQLARAAEREGFSVVRPGMAPR
jgi:uncharacterized protein